MERDAIPIKSHRVHVRLKSFRGSEEVIIPLFYGLTATEPDRLSIPQKLLFEAEWIYDLTARKILKNSTSRNFFVPLGVQEVDRDWLVRNGFLRGRLNPTEHNFVVTPTGQLSIA